MNRVRPSLVALLAVNLVIAAGGIAALRAPVPASAAGVALNGGGSSFAKLEIDQWRAEVARQPFGLTVNYTAQGSSFGRQQFRDGNLDFGASDIPFLANELASWPASQAQRKNFVYVPVSAGGLGFMYNLRDTSGNRITDLALTRRTVCRMFTEPDMRWSDPELVGANPGIALPDEFVRPIVRADGSGTSYVLSEFCATVAPDIWQAFIALKSTDPSVSEEFRSGQPTSNWPVDWGKVGSALAADGVAAAVADDSSGQNAITYNEAGFAKLRGFPNASVQNAAGQFVQPTEDAVSVALAYAEATTDAEGRPGTFRLNFTAADAAAYFPSTYSYVIAQTTGFDPAKGETLARFLCYAVTKGQRADLTRQLGYARLSQPLVDIARNSIAQIPGAPPWENCAVTDSGPPPTQATTIPQTTVASATTVAGATATTTAGGSVTATTIAGVFSSTSLPTIGSDSSLVTIPLDPAASLPVGVENLPAGASLDGIPVIRVPASTSVSVPVVRPAISPGRSAPRGAEIAWVLLQGAGVCALGALVMVGRRKVATG